MSRIEVAALSGAQQAELPLYGARWAAARRATAPVDRMAAAAGVRKAYAAAGLAPPDEILWADGPAAATADWVKSRGVAGENVRALVVDQARRKAELAVDRAVSLNVRVALAAEPGLARVPAFCNSIDEAILRHGAGAGPALRARLLDIILPSRRDRLRLGFAAGSCSFFSTAWLGSLEYLHDVCGLVRHTGGLAGLWQIARNASWMLPHRQACWLVERPQILRIDASERLHAPDGPALSYRDGWSAYAWKGIVVPAWVIDKPERINVDTIDAASDPQVRRCLIDILTPQRFIAQGGAYRVAHDETGVLWRQRWRWEAWAAVEVVNGTPEPDGTHKHYFLQVPATMRSAREAVAWTYGLTEQRYKPTVRT